MPGSSLSPDEERLAKDWKINDNMAPSKIAGLLRRDKSTITRLLKRTVPRKKRGPKLMLTEAQVDALVACSTFVFRCKRRVGAAEDACIAWRPKTSLCLGLLLPTRTGASTAISWSLIYIRKPQTTNQNTNTQVCLVFVLET